MRTFLLHPTDRALASFADSGDAAPQPMRQHLASCQRCRSTIAFYRDLRAAARSLPLAEPPSGLIGRVMAERSRGDRFVLPSTEGPSTVRTNTGRLVAIAAGLLVIVGLAAAVLRAPRRAGDSRAVATDPGRGESFGSALSLIRSVEAQELPARPRPGAPPLTHVSGRRLHAGRMAFAQRWTDSTGRQTIDSHGILDVQPGVLGTLDVWRVVSAWTGNIGAYGERTELESLTVAREDLRPLTRIVHAAPYSRYSRINISQSFRGDSVLGVMTAEMRDSVTVRRPIAQRLPVAFAPYISEALSPLMLTSAEFTPGWRRSLSLLGWAVRSTDLLSSVELRLVGADRITVPAGAFDCWRLSLATGSHRVTYWVRKSDGLGILSRDESKRGGKGIREMVLVHE